MLELLIARISLTKWEHDAICERLTQLRALARTHLANRTNRDLRSLLARLDATLEHFKKEARSQREQCIGLRSALERAVLAFRAGEEDYVKPSSGAPPATLPRPPTAAPVVLPKTSNDAPKLKLKGLAVVVNNKASEPAQESSKKPEKSAEPTQGESSAAGAKGQYNIKAEPQRASLPAKNETHKPKAAPQKPSSKEDKKERSAKRSTPEPSTSSPEQQLQALLRSKELQSALSALISKTLPPATLKQLSAADIDKAAAEVCLERDLSPDFSGAYADLSRDRKRNTNQVITEEDPYADLEDELTQEELKKFEAEMASKKAKK